MWSTQYACRHSNQYFTPTARPFPHFSSSPITIHVDVSKMTKNHPTAVSLNYLPRVVPNIVLTRMAPTILVVASCSNYSSCNAHNFGCGAPRHHSQDFQHNHPANSLVRRGRFSMTILLKHNTHLRIYEL